MAWMRETSSLSQPWVHMWTRTRWIEQGYVTTYLIITIDVGNYVNVCVMCEGETERERELHQLAWMRDIPPLTKAAIWYVIWYEAGLRAWLSDEVYLALSLVIIGDLFWEWTSDVLLLSLNWRHVCNYDVVVYVWVYERGHSSISPRPSLLLCDGPTPSLCWYELLPTRVENYAKNNRSQNRLRSFRPAWSAVGKWLYVCFFSLKA